jgi:hypothetical protein
MSTVDEEIKTERRHKTLLAYIDLLDGPEREYAIAFMEYLTHPPRVLSGIGPVRATSIRARIVSELSQEIFVL